MRPGLDTVLLNALRLSGEPMTRVELGQAIGRKGGKLNRYDVIVLEQLAAAGQVIIGERVQGVVQTAITYQAVLGRIPE